MDSYNKLFDTEVELQNKEAEMFALSQEKEAAKALEGATKKAEAWAKYYDEVDKLAGDFAASKARLLGGQTEGEFAAISGPEQLGQLATLNHEIEKQQQEHDEKMIEEAQKVAREITKQQKEQTDAYMKIFNPINRAMDGMVNGILQGTMSISQAFARMGGNILLTTIDAITKAGLRWAEHFIVVEVLEKSSTLKRIADFISGEGIKHAAQVASTGTEATLAAGIASAWAFESVMASLPFPLNVATAPGVAATTFSEVIALGLPKAEMGAMVPRDMGIYAHAGEMILPKSLSDGLSKMISGGGGGGATNISVSAMDASSFKDFAHRNQRQFAAAFKGMIRNGARS